MDLVFNTLKRFFATQEINQIFWIAYSGGLDSHVLLHACSQLRSVYPLQLRAVYINHHLSPHANDWALHCKRVCEKLGIDFLEKKIHLVLKDQSLEAAARKARYAALAECVGAGDVLLTAHQEEDQAETVLLQLFRGAGPKGLAAMPLVKSFAKGVHARPFLPLSRADLEKYADQNQLRWIEDESNTNVSFDRNFLRLEILPILKKRWPTVTKTLRRTANHCAEVQSLIEKMAEEDLNAVREQSISIEKLLQLSPERQRQVLRRWFQELRFPLPSVLKMQQIQDYFLSAAPDKSPHLIWGKVELRRFQNKLYAMPCLPPHDQSAIFTWNLSESLSLPGGGVLNANPTKGAGVRANVGQLEVRFRQGGERCQLPGRKGRHELKKLFQQWQLPPWERDRMPLLFFEDQLVAVPSFFIDARIAASQDETGLDIFYAKISQP